MQTWDHVSLWMDQLGDSIVPRAPLEHDIDADVAIIGAGFTGLWTAYYLKQQAPSLKVVILEAQTAGFGASGRNGGWLMGGMLGDGRLTKDLSPERRKQAFKLLKAIPDDVRKVLDREQIDCHFRKAGVLYCAARYPEQADRLRADLDGFYQDGHSEADYVWLDRAQLAEHVRIPSAYGAIFSPHCATIQPALLVRGLARTVERLGVTIYDNTRVLDWQSRAVKTRHGTVKAQWIVPAVEGYAAGFSALKHVQLPVQSLIVATAPLTDAQWAEIGLNDGQALSEYSRQVTYAQRSKDGRLIFGARGGYQFGGRLREDFRLTDAEVGLRRQLMESLFPSLRGVKLTHAWGGNLGMARRFRPHMLRDPSNGIALAGGFGGEGVGATHLAGQTLADLILGNAHERTDQPWVMRDTAIGDLSTWEPEPCRWLGYKAIISAFANEDRVLDDPRTPKWRRRLAEGVASRLERFMR